MNQALRLPGRPLLGGSAQGELLFADIGLSFWGGVDPATSEVIDRHHPLSGQLLRDRMLAIPSGRGSCTGSSVLLELILAGLAPAAIILREPDEILALGALVAEELFDRSLPVFCVGAEAFDLLARGGAARLDGELLQLGGPFDEPSLAATHDNTTPRVELSEQDLRMQCGELGEAARVAMRIVLRMAELQGARHLIDVRRAHIDGCIYTGPASLRFARTLLEMGARVQIPTTLNSISVDERHWREQGIPEALGSPASDLARTYVAMGAAATFSCAPYLLEDTAQQGEDIAWAESNAVVFANSVLGARTNKYADFMDLCIALTGRAPLAGCHLTEQRRARVLLRVSELAGLDDAFYPTLGYLCGLLSGSRIPVIAGLENTAPARDALKAFGAAFGTSSAAPMFHIAGVTPEAPDVYTALGGQAAEEEVAITLEDLRQAWAELDSAPSAEVQLVALGNPHFSAEECAALAHLCSGLGKHPQVAVLITTSRHVLEQAHAAGHVAVLEAFGAHFVTDTCWCMVGEPLLPPATRTLITNSAKYAHYAPGLVGRAVRFASLAGCVEAARTGLAPGRQPAWLASDAQKE
jgi:predicted aconitase/predicted aconitase with swiveling domain